MSHSLAPIRAAAVLIIAGVMLAVVTTVRVDSQSPGSSEGWQIPDGAAAEANPVPATPAALAKGKALFKSKCQRCHGVTGKGNGPDADPDHSPGDLTDGKRASRNPDGVMFYKIWNGRAKPKMPAMKTDVPREDVWTVIQYVKTLRVPVPVPRSAGFKPGHRGPRSAGL